MALRRLINLTMCVWLLNTSAVGAAGQTSDRFDLSALETRLFEHDNHTLPMADRLARVEEFVFGRVKKGSCDERTALLTKTVSRLQIDSSIELRSLADANSQRAVPSSASVSSALAGNEVSFARPDSHVSYGPILDNRAESVEEQESAGVSTGLVPKVAGMEQEVFVRNFDGEPVLVRIHRLENQILPNIVIAEGEPLTLQVGRLEDRVFELRKTNSVPISSARAFDEEVYRQDAQSRLENARSLPSDDELLSEINQLRDLAHATDSGYSNNSSDSSDASDQQNNSKSHGFKHAMFDTLRILISGAAYTF